MENCSINTFSVTNVLWTLWRLNTDLRGKTPGSNRLMNRPVLVCEKCFEISAVDKIVSTSHVPDLR
jgi:hypothetical protein